MNFWHFAGILICIAMFVGVEIISMRRVHTASDFEKGGGKAGPALVIGTLLGTMLGGQATMGTAQLGYLFGTAGIWFTLGAAIGCLILGLVYAKPMHRSEHTTIVEAVKDEYGERTEITGSVLSTVGTLISAVSNMIAATALISVIFGWPLLPSCILAVILDCIYVVAGGVVGAGMGGVVKMILLYATSVVCLVVAIVKAGEFGPGTAIDFRLVDVFSRGVWHGLSSGLSLVVGILSTQTYAQAIWSAKDDKTAKWSGLISAFLCVPVGICGVVIGIYMRNIGVEQTSEAYPLFLINELPSLLGGIGLGALLITVVTGGGGLALGVSTVMTRDVIGRIMGDRMTEEKRLMVSRVVIVASLGLVALIAMMMPGAIINDLGFLSLGLRGTVLLVPFALAIFRPGKYKRNFIFASMLAGPAALVIVKYFIPQLDPIIIGILVATVVALAGKKRT